MGNRARARSHETIPSSIRPVAEIAPLPSLADLAERIDLKAITVQPHTPGSASLDDIPEPDLVRALGATYHTGRATDVGFQPDVIVECTGVGQVITDSISFVGAGGIVCLTGVGAGGWTLGHSTADIAATMVLRNKVIVGSVNANKRHWYKAGQALAQADATWLARLLSRRERPEAFMNALHRQPDDIKVVIQFGDA